MEQLGHTDPKFTLRVYAHAMRFSTRRTRARLKAFAEGGVLAPIGTGDPSDERVTPEIWAFRVGAAGFEPATSRV